MNILPIDAERSKRMFNSRPVEIAANRCFHNLGLEGPFHIRVTYAPPDVRSIDPSRPFLTVSCPDWTATYVFRPADADASTYGFEPPEDGYELRLPMHDFRPLRWDDWKRMSRKKRVQEVKRLWQEQEQLHARSLSDRVDTALSATLRRHGWSIVSKAGKRPVTENERQLLVGAIAYLVGRNRCHRG